MIVILLAGMLAWAAEPDVEAPEPPVCSTTSLEALPRPPEKLAVAWVAPWRRHPSGRLTVVPTAELRGWLAEQNPRWTGRTLQWLGLRRRNTDPKRRFQVRILEVERDQLCRPVDGVEEGVPVADIPACKPRLLGPDRQTDGCGRALDRRTGEPGPTRYVVKLNDVDDRGYCVVPLTRYVEEVGTK